MTKICQDIASACVKLVLCQSGKSVAKKNDHLRFWSNFPQILEIIQIFLEKNQN